MEVIPDFKAATLNDFIHKDVTPGSTIYTDGLMGFAGLEAIAFKHVSRRQPMPTELRKRAKSVVSLADRAIGNLKQWLLGTRHGANRRHLQVSWMNSSFDIIGEIIWKTDKCQFSSNDVRFLRPVERHTAISRRIFKIGNCTGA
jgi:hypothetical protein